MLSYVKEKLIIYSYVTLVIKNTKHAFASKGTQIVYLNPNLRKNEEIQQIWKAHFKIEFMFDRVIFYTID